MNYTKGHDFVCKGLGLLQQFPHPRELVLDFATSVPVLNSKLNLDQLFLSSLLK